MTPGQTFIFPNYRDFWQKVYRTAVRRGTGPVSAAQFADAAVQDLAIRDKGEPNFWRKLREGEGPFKP